MIECADCHRPIEYDDAEEVERHPLAIRSHLCPNPDGPRLVCADCAARYGDNTDAAIHAEQHHRGAQ